MHAAHLLLEALVVGLKQVWCLLQGSKGLLSWLRVQRLIELPVVCVMSGE
jgi:hypothetical protein